MKRKLISLAIISTFAGCLLASCSSSETGDNTNNIVDTQTPVPTGSTELTPEEIFKNKTMEIYSLAIQAGYNGTYEEWISSIKGDEIELQISGKNIQWKYKAASEWKNLYDLDTLKADKGNSAYEIYKAMNPDYPGTEEDWINDLVLGTLLTTKGESRVEDDKETEGLEFTLSSDGTYYILSGIGKEIITTEVVVSSTYNGLPVKEVGSYAFNYRNDLVKISLPSSITKINDAAFYGCSALTTFKFGPAYIGKDAFYGCNKLTNVYFRGNDSDWFNNEYAELTSNPMNFAKNLYLETNSGSIYNANSQIVFDIPTTVTKINDYAFIGMSEVVGIVIPTTVTSIGKSAFNGASNLETITVPYVGRNGEFEDASFGIIFGDEPYAEATPVSQQFIKEYEGTTAVLDNNTYYIPSKLKNITVKSEFGIHAYAFSNLAMIESVYIDAPVVETAEHMFDGCVKLKKVKLTDKVEKITKFMFVNCAAIDTINIPNNVENISESAFEGCSSIKEITISNNIRYIYTNAFKNCTQLEALNIASNDVRIYKNAFINSNIKALNFYEDRQLYIYGQYETEAELIAGTPKSTLGKSESNINRLSTTNYYFRIYMKTI